MVDQIDFTIKFSTQIQLMLDAIELGDAESERRNERMARTTYMKYQSKSIGRIFYNSRMSKKEEEELS